MKNIQLDKIYNESCLETLKKIPDNFIDLVITSPPYNMNLRIRKGEYCSRQIVKEISTKYEGFSDNLPIEEYFEFHSNVLKELLRVSNLVFYVVISFLTAMPPCCIAMESTQVSSNYYRIFKSIAITITQFLN